jgi:hypothetical protein
VSPLKVVYQWKYLLEPEIIMETCLFKDFGGKFGSIESRKLFIQVHRGAPWRQAHSLQLTLVSKESLDGSVDAPN